MLRITVHDFPEALVLQLEGRVAVPWLLELETCWRKTVSSGRKPFLTVDLTGVSFIDAAGKACLAAMRRRGASFVAGDCLTRGILEEITNAGDK